jgi:hypothetical protein
MNMKRYFGLWAILLSPLSLYCQNDRLVTVDSIREHFIRQVQVFPQEKIYIQTDKPEYIAGDTVWFKTYLTDAVVHLPSELSRFVYIELINPLDKLMQRLKVRIAPNQSHGQIAISDTLPEGNYTLRAYTGTMFGMDEQSYYHKNIYIHTPLSAHIKDSISFQFNGDKVFVSIGLEKRKEKKNILSKKLKVQVNDNPLKTIKTDGAGWANFTFNLSENSKKRVLYIGCEEDNYFFSKYISIPFPYADYALSFFPEGGNLLEGRPCKIAFKALKNNGLSENIHGEIIDNSGTTVIPAFESLHKGMGSFTLTPEAGKSYTAIVQNNNGLERKFELPAAVKDASSLSVIPHKNKIRLSVNHSSGGQASESQYLIVHSRGVVLYAEPWNPSVSYLDLEKESFPSGILQALLLDKNLNPLSERLLFCINENDQAHLSFQADKTDFKAREHLYIDLYLSDKEDDPLEGNFSVSVTNNEVAVDTTSNILTTLLLTSDLRGYIETPAFYFEKNNPISIEALDNLMLTQGWRRYNIPEIIKGHLEELPGFVELGQEISGSVKGLIRTKGLAHAKVSIISPTNRSWKEVDADETGNFAFTGLNFPDNTEFVVQAHSAKWSEKVDLVVKKDEFPPIRPSYTFAPVVEQIIKSKEEEETFYRAGEEFINGMRLIRLQEVEIRGTRKKRETTDIFQQLADKSFGTKQFEEYSITSMAELVYFIPGVRFDEIKNTFFIRGGVSILYETPAAVAVDGIIVYTPVDDSEDSEGSGGSGGTEGVGNSTNPLSFDFSSINMNDIERVDFFKSGSAVIWGPRGGGGVVSITTKRGNSTQMDNIRFNVNRIKPLGYLVPAEFYSPEYKTEAQQTSDLPDYRTTLFWKPNVNTDEDGSAFFEFYASDKPEVYTVVMEGITKDGQIIYQRGQIKPQ